MEGGVIQWLNQFEQSQNVRDGLIACHKNGGGEEQNQSTRSLWVL